MTDKVVIITGPTASGKSSIAVEVAKNFKSEIISCDSQQIYKDMDIGTNKIKEFEMNGIKHHMIDFISPNEEYSVEDFSKTARNCIFDINNRGNLPIITGGTGFYIDSILFDMNYGLSPKNIKIREKYQEIKENKGEEYLYNLLRNIDEKSANKYHYKETNRIIRALEIFETTGKKPSEIRKGSNVKNNNIDPILFFINYEDRSILYKKINERVIKMFEEGLYEEFLNLLEKYKLDENNQSMKAIGYKELFELYNNKLNKDEVINLIQRNTRRYAKRQITWMKKYLKYDFTSYILRDKKSKDELVKEISGEIRRKYDI
ncbi:MAG: tRNA (adenosine(37)-N6)-dimethylallyltransferase MiaA [Peptoniphilaceae bacterium]|nr:tRNA (adenosine(37)-N6)-dimethylallyltransferase MiaA [Peptoniphilaceae bacterium]MDY6019615.1 tRNA (adenosine(37)-N6)-dimethylallyltransferase MiaA [Anaerococcus sp.]